MSLAGRFNPAAFHAFDEALLRLQISRVPMNNQVAVNFHLPDELIDEIVRRIVAETQKPTGYLDVTGAAEYLGYTGDRTERGKRRLYDLVSQRRVRFVKDGSRLLFKAQWLDDYLGVEPTSRPLKLDRGDY